MSQDPAEQDPNELEDARAGRVEESGNDNRADEFEEPDGHALTDGEQLPADSFHIWCDLEQQRLGIGRRLRPELKDFFPNQRPILDGIGRHRNCQLSCIDPLR